ncbi:PREDICTED: serine/threonine-protein kinase 17A-like [Nicrophorus vespilloides]|uniref:Serine/threonine-protein kinase 17A-like n=1 Tax=Nicrophorus vespilloides TaxID=110193 RepID=A0ABM1MVG4_NICVS|nr:PREDICTED: serine/threonine-protein kinase 17A-like [Nicrophorus vespilloides]
MEYEEGMLTLDECDKKAIRKVSLNKFYKKSTTLGRGYFGIVRKIVHKKTGLSYAAKYIKKNKSEENWLEAIHHEIAVLQSVSTLHSQNLVHMDIKSDNILLSEPDSFDNIKLCDFGLAKCLESGKEVRTTQGTLDYVPPEVLKQKPITKKSDVWSIGVLTYYLVSGYTPFTVKTDFKTMTNIENGILEFGEESFRSISVECIDFIKSMLVVDPDLRPTVDELLQHAWFSTDI